MKRPRLERLDLNLLKVFDAVYIERHVTRAAMRLFISQSAVSHSLRNLRHVFGDPLFIRTPEGMTPTALAERLAGRVSRALNEMQDVLAYRSDFDPAVAEAHVTIGLLAGPPPWLIPALCRAIQAQAPGISLAFQATTTDVVADLLDSRALQLVVGAPNRMQDRRRFVYEPLLDDGIVCVVGRDNDAVGGALDLATYARLPHLAVASSRFTRTWIDELLARTGHRREVMALVPSPVYIADILAGTPYVCTIMRNLVPPDARLRLLPPPFATEPQAFGQFSHGRDEENPLLLWLRGEVRAVCATHALGPIAADADSVVPFRTRTARP